MHKIAFILLLLITSNFASAHDLPNKPGQVIKVGVWKNPPVVLQMENGEWNGIAIEVLQAIADQEGWQLKFIPGTFAEQLKNLKNHKIDLLTAIAYTAKRSKLYTFTRYSLISNWGLIYARADSRIDSLLDLENKKVSVMRNNIHDKAFRKLIDKFGINSKLIEVDNFSDVMKSVQTGEADAGVINRLFGAVNAEKYHLVETGIIFNPINLHYAAPLGSHTAILKTIDRYLNAFKADKNSIYYASMRHWMGLPTAKQLPSWLPWLATSLLGAVLLMIGMNLWLRRQVARRTQELQIEVDERRLAQERLDRLAYYDSLTGLPNRVSFSENIKIAIATARRRNSKVAVLFVDLDQFKTINDSLGHDAGDRLIVQVAQRLQLCLRDEDTINRFGGDEFVATLQDIHDPSGIDQVASRMLKCLSTPINVGLTEVYTSVSIGIALFPDDDDSSDGLLKDADAAMYHAKAQGGNNYQFYNVEFTNRVRDRLNLETRLRYALERDEFLLHYQPIFDLATQSPVAVEALIRWQDPQHGLITPDNFIASAEETGLIVPLGEWALEHSCAQIREWESQGLGQLRLAVNVSSRQFVHNKLPSTVLSALRNSKLSPQRLDLEITERMFLKLTPKVSATLNQLKNEGIGLSIDDFGTGYSSLNYLKQLPIDTLKIDRSFVKNIPSDMDDVQIASTIIAMAHNLGLQVVAEGIETEEQLRLLTTWGCRWGQGYYMARPQPVDTITSWLADTPVGKIQ